ncbi:hypothetical protein TWF694_008361 [Orbilia ellipsospora]|uniref:Uncharacterized protein n=1 Tax=Orbilia ellipsospora TaxID=2528407 RepID=A0AAV9XFV0_9PEZI
MRWEGSDCWLGLYRFENYKSVAIGGSDTQELQPQLDTCITLAGDWDNVISSYRVGGDCLCQFFDGPSCDNFIFDAFARGDPSLKANGGNQNKISSYRCSSTYGASCSIDLKYEDGRLLQTLVPLYNNPGGENICWHMGDAALGSTAKILQRNCKCQYWTDGGCNGDTFFTYRQVGWGAEDVSLAGNMLGSMMCQVL